MLHDLPVVPWRDVGSIDRATRGAQQWSVLVSPSSYVTERMRTAYRYQGPVLEVGYPRNDVLHAPDRYRLGARVRARLNLPKDKLVVLYAPTFRDRRHPGGRLSVTLPCDLDRLHDALGDDTVLLLRMHLLVSTVFKIPPHLRDFVQDVSHYPEVQELYLASDALVTDYSSVFFDFAQLRRPMIFYAHDLAAYRDRLRGFYLDYEDDVPGPVVTTEEALIDALTDLDAVVEKYAERLDGFLQRFAPRDDGHAAERVVKELFGFHS
jgi:CDP-glycerol glycerophosphotransferase